MYKIKKENTKEEEVESDVKKEKKTTRTRRTRENA